MAAEIKVWDLFQRIGHWMLAAAFFIAYLTAEEVEDVHIVAGYVVGIYVVARLIWGFIGSANARFATFIRAPREVFAYLIGLTRGTARRYLGHNPAGGAMVVALLIGLGGTVFTGLAIEAETENEGPLAFWLGDPQAAAPRAVDIGEGEAEERESAYEDVHEGFANFTLALVVLHLLGVIASSVAHRENLPRSMITGRKRPESLDLDQ